jgi:hypothetical protein
MGVIAENAEALTAKLVELARTGDRVAMRLCIDRVLGPARTQPLETELEAPSDDIGLARGLARIIEAVGAGELTPSEAATLCGVLKARRRATWYLKPEQLAATLPTGGDRDIS